MLKLPQLTELKINIEKLFTFYTLFVYVYLLICMSTMSAVTHGDQKRSLDLGTVVTGCGELPYMGAGNRVHMLCKRSKCS